jgi:hypothetical protein
MTRLYGRAPQGARVVGSVPQHEGQDVTVLATLGDQGRHAVMTVAGATEAAVFRANGTHGRGPRLAPGARVVRDHGGAHTAGGLQQRLARRRGRRLYWPPDSPRCRRSRPGGRRAKRRGPRHGQHGSPGPHHGGGCPGVVSALRLRPTVP